MLNTRLKTVQFTQVFPKQAITTLAWESRTE